MKRSAIIGALVVHSLLVFGTFASADQAAQAKSLVEKAVAMAQEKGLNPTLDLINDLKGPFVQGDLYVFAMSLENLRLAAGSPYNKPKLGTVATADFNKEMAEIAKTKGSGWVEYSWPKPNEKKPAHKRTFIMRVPGENAYFGCGYYKE